MTSKTHVALGLLVGLAITKYYPSQDIYIVVSGACIGSLLPDLDTKKSDPSQIFPIISSIVDRFTKHRGFTHTIFPLLLIILYYQYKYIPFLMLGVGSISHALIDVITLGIGITCNSIGEKIIYYSLWLCNLGLLILILLEWQGVKVDVNVALINDLIKLRR